MKSIFKSIVIAATMLFGFSNVQAAVYDTSYVCSGTGVVLKASDSVNYTMNWLNEANTSVGTDGHYIIPSATTTIANSATPVKFIYKLVVDSLGGASCSSDTFYKVVYALPSFNVAIDSGSAFYCVGSIPTNVVLASNVTATGTTSVPNLATLPAYAAINYGWTNGTSPAGTATGTPVGQTYTISGASLVSAGIGSYAYTNTVGYDLGTYTIGIGASAGTCTFSGSVTVDITPQPSIQNVNVQTSFQ